MHLLMKIIGYASGPLITRALIDNTCLFWKYSHSGERESCQLYALPEYRRSFSLLMFIPGLLSISGFLAVYNRTKRKQRCLLYIVKPENTKN